MEPNKINKKIKEYETFLEETLKKDLKEVQDTLEDKVNKYKEWEEVKQMVTTLREFKEKDRDMNIQLEIGCGVHAYGEITSYERTYIDIGLGYLLCMNYDEAEKYADIRLRSLKRDIDHFRNLAVHIKVNIKMVLLAINELQTATLSQDLKRVL